MVLTNAARSLLRGFHVQSVRRKSSNISLVLSDQSRDGVDKERAGVVLMFGWTGSAFKHLQKYSEIYQKKGETVVQYCPSPLLVYKPHPRKDYHRMSEEFLTILSENGLEKQPVFFHSFSNGGTYMYYHLVQELFKRGANIRGTILDSTPGKSGYYLIKGSVAQVSPGNVVLKTAIGVTGWLYCEMLLRYKRTMDRLAGKDPYNTEDYRYYLHRSMITLPNREPQLCLFSKVDDVTFYRDVEEYIRRRKELGADISGKLWDGSRHVKHLVDHPEEYVSLVENFFEECRRETPAFKAT